MQAYDVKKYIPQDEPFVMISDLLSVSETEAVSVFYIDDKCIFVKDGFLDESGIVENIAQTAAAMSGYNQIKNGGEVKKGFIGSVESLNICNLPVSNSSLETKVIIKNVVMDVNIIKGTVQQKNEIIAECRMKIFLNR